jgi:hypothetical protein
MAFKFTEKSKTIAGFSICTFFAALLLFTNLGRFGMWEPQEIQLAETSANGKGAPRFSRIEQRLSALGSRRLGQTEKGARLPIAVMALVTAMLLFLVIFSLSDLKLAVFGTLFYVGAPFFIYHGKQLTGGMPLLLAEVAAIGGLAVAMSCQKKSVRIIGGLLGLFGVILGCRARGVLVGGFAPLMTVATAFLVSGAGEASDEKRAARQRLVAYFMIGAALLLAGLYFSIVHLTDTDLVAVTGGIDPAVGKRWTFDFAFEQIVYSWYPFIVLLPIAVAPFFTPSPRSPRPGTRPFLRALAIMGLLFGYLAQMFDLEVSGLAPAAVGLPIALGIALAIDDILQEEQPDRLLLFLSAAMLTLLIRDFAQNNQTLLYGYGFDKIPIPEKQFSHVIQASLAAIPFALLIVTAFFKKSKWRGWALSFLIPLAPMCLGGVIAFVMVPGLSVQLSSKHAVEVYRKYRTNNEPLAVYGKARFFADAEKLKNTQEVVAWLSRSDRVFAVFPPDKLPDLDHRMRQETGKHIHVLDAESDRFYVATSQPKPGEKNNSPIAPFVQSEPFTPAPRHATDINFDDVVTLTGWDLEADGKRDQLVKGKEMVFTTYWHMTGRFRGNYKIFMHIDGPGGRVHGDHDPFEGKLPTLRWQKGDYIKEVYRKQIPLYQGSGEYTIRMGLYQDSGRLSVKNDPSAKENSVFITTIMLE